MRDPLIKGGIGSDADYDLSFEDGQLVFSLRYDGEGVDGEVRVYLDPSHFIDLMAKAIPGQVDDAVFALIKNAFLKN